MAGWLDETLRLTYVLLVASVAVILAGILGFGGSLTVAIGLFALTGACFGARTPAAGVGRVRGWPVGSYLSVTWIGTLVAVVAVLLASGATPAELQAVGGLVGLAGMANYFLRPVYYAVYAGVQYVGRTVDV